MKYTFRAQLFAVCLFTMTNLFSQINENLSETDFYNIKVDNKTLTDIANTNGEIGTMNNLFGTLFLVSESDIPNTYNWRNFENKEMLITFNEDQNNNLAISGIKITGNNTLVKVKDKTFSVGDNINKLRFMPLSTTSQGYNYLNYAPEGSDISFYVKYNTQTLLIVETGLYIPL